MLVLIYALTCIERPLHDAAVQGDIPAMRKLIAQGHDVDGKDENGFTPLMSAANKGQPDSISFLLRNGANPNASHVRGRTPLHMAIDTQIGRVEVVRLLLLAGAKPDPQIQGAENPFSLAMQCNAEIEVFELLLAAGYDLKAKVGQGYFQLLAAAAAGRGDVVELLLKVGAPVQFNHPDGRTLVMFAAQPRDATDKALKPLRTLIAAGAPVQGADATGATALHYAARSRSRLTGQVMRMLLDAGANADLNAKTNVGMTPLMEVARLCSYKDAAEVLRDAGADLTAQDLMGNVALHWAIRGPVDPELGILWATIEHEAIQHKNKLGWTPLMEAARHGFVDIVERLLQAGADPNIRNQDGWTPLMIAAAATPDNESIWKTWYDQERQLYLEVTHQKLDEGLGSHPAAFGSWRASRVGRVWTLLSYGADPDIKSNDGETVHTILHKLNDPQSKVTRTILEMDVKRLGLEDRAIVRRILHGR